MKNDLSNVKVGDWIWTIFKGWVRVERTDPLSSWPIKSCGYSFTLDGKVIEHDKYPSAFTEPPECFNAEPKPYEFNKGDRVVVGIYPDNINMRAYFSHMASDGTFYCFSKGRDEWAADGYVDRWGYCKKWEEGE